MKTQNLTIAMVGEEIGLGLDRLVQVIPLAALVTAALVIFMERLVFMADSPLDETPPLVIRDIHWEEPVIQTRKEEMVEKPPEAQEPPELPETNEVVDHGVDIKIPATPVVAAAPQTLNLGFGANLPIAQYLVQPRYPASALRRGLEGYVDVKFDVTEIGTTDNITVLGAQPQGVFESAAVAAVKRWRYQPKKVDNTPVRFEGLSNRIRFEMQD